MPITTQETNDEITINVEGRFDFSCHSEFTNAMSNKESSGSRYIVDLSRTSYLDSSALGMLLLLRESVGNDINRILLKRPSIEVKKLLELAKFDQIFNIN